MELHVIRLVALVHGVQLNRDLVHYVTCMQNTLESWRLKDLTSYVQYHITCTTAYLLVHHDSHHMHKTVICRDHW